MSYADAYNIGFEKGKEAGSRSLLKEWTSPNAPVSWEARLAEAAMEVMRLRLDAKIFPKEISIDTSPSFPKRSREGLLRALAQGVSGRENNPEYIAAAEFIREESLDIVRNGEMFEFGDYRWSGANADWRPFAEAGLIDLPFPRTIFSVCFKYSHEGKDGHFDLMWLAKQPIKGDPISLLCLFVNKDSDEFPLMVAGYHLHSKASLQAHKLSFNDHISNIFFVMWLVLNTKNIPTERIVPAEKLNRARVKSGKEPLQPYTKIDTEAYVTALRETERMEGEGKGTHASPRPHLRRAHLRHYASGAIVPIMATIVNGNLGLKAAVRDKYVVPT